MSEDNRSTDAADDASEPAEQHVDACDKPARGAR